MYNYIYTYINISTNQLEKLGNLASQGSLNQLYTSYYYYFYSLALFRGMFYFADKEIFERQGIELEQVTDRVSVAKDSEAKPCLLSATNVAPRIIRAFSLSFFRNSYN